MSPKTKSKVRKYLATWLNGVQQNAETTKKKHNGKNIYPTFVTLTLSSKQNHTDNEIKRQLLNPFIIWLKSSHNVVYYYWRAEPQKNGNIHFHIICDRYIEHTQIKNKWNSLQDKLGYIKPYSTKMSAKDFNTYWSEIKHYKNSNIEKARAYYLENRKKGWINPNSTDIHGIKNLRSLASYVIKYMCKTDGNRQIKGRIHGGADVLRELKAYVNTAGQDAYGLINMLDRTKGIKRKYGEYFTVYYVNTMHYLKANYNRMYFELKSYYNAQFDSLYSVDNSRKSRLNPTEIFEEKISQAVVKKLSRVGIQKELFI